MDKINQFKNKVIFYFKRLRFEITRITHIGLQMFSASKTNSLLNKSYLELGHLVASAIEKNEISWNNTEAHHLVDNIKNLKSNLETIEEEVSQLKIKKFQAEENQFSKNHDTI